MNDIVSRNYKKVHNRKTILGKFLDAAAYVKYNVKNLQYMLELVFILM